MDPIFTQYGILKLNVKCTFGNLGPFDDLDTFYTGKVLVAVKF